MIYQHTVATPVYMAGQALHSGVWVEMRILPQPEDTGIFFRRNDLPDEPDIKADITAVMDTKSRVSIGRNNWSIGTIEHLMAAFHGLGVDNALVEVNHGELPMGDGSGQFFAERILAAGLLEQRAPRRFLRVETPIWIEGTVPRQQQSYSAFMVILPCEVFKVSYTFTSDHHVTGTQYYHYTLCRDSFLKEIAPARTIAFMKEVEYMRSQGLAMGGDINSVVAVGEDGYLNQLRFPDELVRHKILDVLGDMYFLGPLYGHVIAVRSGHALDLALAAKIKAATG